MSRYRKDDSGFTLIELLISITVIGIMGITAYGFSTGSISDYLKIQEDGLRLGGLAEQSQRLAKVVRGSTDIISGSNTTLSIYSYFSPGDAYVSKVDYYKSTDGKKMLADVTPLTANPPIGTLITANKATYTIVDSFYTPSGVNTFDYLDSSGNVLTLPISDLHTIKGVRVTLAVKSKSSPNSNTTLSLDVALRNRKTNL